MKRPKSAFNKASVALRYIGKDTYRWTAMAVDGILGAMVEQPLIAAIAPAAVILAVPLGIVVGISSGILHAIEEDWEAVSAQEKAIATDNLIEAVKKRDLKAVQGAISSGANVNATLYDYGYNVPIIIHAASHCHDAIVDSLIAAGADVNVRGEHGATAAMWAASMDNKWSWSDGDMEEVRGGTPVLRSLISAGADLSLKDAHGEDALTWARNFRAEENVKLIEQTVKDTESVSPEAGRARAKIRLAPNSFKS